MGLLGCETHKAYIYRRDGERMLFEITGDVANIEWGRVSDAASAARVVLITPSPECCGLLKDVEPWAHELVIYRGTDRVWEGPVTDVTYSRAGVVIDARDVFHWTSKRVHRGRVTGGPVNVMDEWELMLNDVWQAGNNYNILPWFTRIGLTAQEIDRDITPFQMYYSQDLQDMTRNGVSFTVAGRRIILVADTEFVGRIAPLVTGDHIAGDVSVTKAGSELATRSRAITQAGLTAVTTLVPEAVVFYGIVEHLVDVPDEVSALTLQNYVDGDLRDRYPLPYAVEIPAGSQLTPEAPWGIQEIIPGVVFPLKVDEQLCIQFEREFYVQELKVTDGPEGEKVAVTLAPVVPSVRSDASIALIRQKFVHKRTFRRTMKETIRRLMRVESQLRG